MAQKDYQPNWLPEHNVLLALALSRANIQPFSEYDRSAFLDASPGACMVQFWPADSAKLRAALNINHWPEDRVSVILDESGISWETCGARNSYCYSVNVEIKLGGPRAIQLGTPDEMWSLGLPEEDQDQPSGYGEIMDQIATLPEEHRQLIMGAPESVRQHVVNGYMAARAGRLKLPELPPRTVWIFQNELGQWEVRERAPTGARGVRYVACSQPEAITWAADVADLLGAGSRAFYRAPTTDEWPERG